MKLEYLILIVLAVGFYETSVKEAIKARKNKDFIVNNLGLGSKLITKAGTIGEVVEIDKEEVVIVTGSHENHSFMRIKKEEIASIID